MGRLSKKQKREAGEASDDEDDDDDAMDVSSDDKDRKKPSKAKAKKVSGQPCGLMGLAGHVSARLPHLAECEFVHSLNCLCDGWRPWQGTTGDKYDQLKAANIAKMKVLAETDGQREASSGKAKALALISRAGKKVNLQGCGRAGQEGTNELVLVRVRACSEHTLV